MIADLVHSVLVGALHGLAYAAMLILGLLLVEPDIAELLEALP